VLVVVVLEVEVEEEEDFQSVDYYMFSDGG
jgi:hypothetical protein